MWPFSPAYPEVRGSAVNGKTFDYIIVGGGTSGCVLARRLSADPGVSVLVLEKGRVRDSLYSRIPLLSQNMFGPFLQAVYRWSEPVASIAGKHAQLFTAEAIGGATRINAGIVTRGAPAGYEEWKNDLGLGEWGWDKVEPYFKRSERAIGKEGSRWRGQEGLLESRQVPVTFQCYSHLERAAAQLGLPIEKDCNSPLSPASGYCYFDLTIDDRGRRWSVYRAYLGRDMALQRKDRLKICTGVVASKLDIDGRSGVVKGVYFRAAGKRSRAVGSSPGGDWYAQARREVIVCSGAMATPQLLMVSGLGPKHELAKHSIPVIRDLPAVGSHLSDHSAFPVMMDLPPEETLHYVERPLVFLWNLLLWFFWGVGILASMTTPRSVFVRTASLDETTMTLRRDPEASSADRAGIPDVEIMLTGFNCVTTIRGRPVFTLYTTLVQPFSRGRISLVSTDPTAHPRIEYPLLTDPRDRITMRTAMRFAMRYADEFCHRTGYPYPATLSFAPGMDLDALDAFYKAGDTDPRRVPTPGLLLRPKEGLKEMTAGHAAALPSRREPGHLASQSHRWATVSDDEIDAYAQRVGVSALHFACTCRMGRSPDDAVVDQQLRVFGLRNLRIADASVFPRLPSSHTMAPVVVVAERCAEFVRAQWEERKAK